jgi:nucleotide-binding universal stress UspA family protein
MFTPKRLLVPLDFGEPGGHALAHARAIAERFDASLDLLHVVPNPYLDHPAGLYLPLPPSYLDELVNDAQKRLDSALAPRDRERFGARMIVRVGDPVVQIVEYARAESIDLIVMGTHGRSGAAHLFLGSVAERVVRTASCPVLTVR